MIAVKENIQREVEVVHLVAHTLTYLSGELASVVDRDKAFRYRKDSVHATSTFRPSHRHDQGEEAGFPVIQTETRALSCAESQMKIATYNVNGVNGRLSVLLRWLETAGSDVVCLQELKCPDDRFPFRQIEKVGYGAIWHGQKSWNGVAILARGRTPIETRRGLPGDPDDAQSRYIEAAVGGILVGCIYLPNGNPVPARSSITS
jgi:hypothetical protein